MVINTYMMSGNNIFKAGPQYSKNRVLDGRLHILSYLVPHRPRLAETVCPEASNPLLVDNIP